MKINGKTKKIIYGVIIGVAAIVGILLAVALAFYAKSGASSARSGILYAVAALLIILTVLLSVLFALIILNRKQGKSSEVEVVIDGQVNAQPSSSEKVSEDGVRFDGLNKL